MSSSFSSELSKEIKLCFNYNSNGFTSKILSILSSIFKSFIDNESNLSSKVYKILDDLGNSD
jgi:hypothetical protein